MIICDNCKKDITTDTEDLDDEDEQEEHNTLNLNGGKKTFCDDCYYVLSEWACSEEHKKALKKYLKEIEEA